MNSSFEKISQFAILVIALAAVFVSVWQGVMTREHNKLSVKPLLDYNNIWDRTNEETIQKVSVSNKGIGPAILKNMTFYLGEKCIPSIRLTLKDASKQEELVSMMTYGTNTPLTPSKEAILIWLRKKDNSRSGIRVKIDYESIYGDDFTLDFGF